MFTPSPPIPLSGLIDSPDLRTSRTGRGSTRAPHEHARSSNSCRLITLKYPRLYSMMPAACNGFAAAEMDTRRTPSNTPIRS